MTPHNLQPQDGEDYFVTFDDKTAMEVLACEGALEKIKSAAEKYGAATVLFPSDDRKAFILSAYHDAKKFGADGGFILFSLPFENFTAQRAMEFAAQFRDGAGLDPIDSELVDIDELTARN
jgi:hypothetical protein